MRYGIRSITMDDIARELGISKKTLYQYVENKSDLIEHIFQDRISCEKEIMEKIREESVDAVDEMLQVGRYFTRELRQISPTVMYDLQKYYRSTWKEMKTLHRQYVYQLIRENMERGIEQGLYREDMDPDIIAKLYVGKTFQIVDEELFPLQQYDLKKLFEEFISYHMHGIASTKGLERMRLHKEKARREVSE